MNPSSDQQKLQHIRDREPGHPVNQLFLQRWSPRAYDASPMPGSTLLTILEAARWAPSAFNIQPWRFVYALRGDAWWDSYVELLDAFNASWAQQASALVFVVSDTLMPGNGTSPPKPSPTHSFDAGAAWAQLALQATALGYQAHAMAGIRFVDARQRLAVPDRYRIEIAVAIGRQTEPANLPPGLRERERPSDRLPLDTIVFAGEFPSQPAVHTPGVDGSTGEARS